jgi:hypothetical protein
MFFCIICCTRGDRIIKPQFPRGHGQSHFQRSECARLRTTVIASSKQGRGGEGPHHTQLVINNIIYLRTKEKPGFLLMTDTPYPVTSHKFIDVLAINCLKTFPASSIVKPLGALNYLGLVINDGTYCLHMISGTPSLFYLFLSKSICYIDGLDRSRSCILFRGMEDKQHSNICKNYDVVLD